MTWAPDESALGLLDERGGPYETSGYRRACAEAVPRLHDRSFGARAGDGTVAAVALMRSGRRASSVPFGYGGVQSSRPLDRAETGEFLRAARRACGAWSLQSISIADGEQGDVIGTTLLVDASRDPAGVWDATAARKLRRLERDGFTCSPADGPQEFLPVYRVESAGWGVRYPEALVHAAHARGIARFYSVRDTSGNVVSVLAALTARAHWVYWFGAQTDAGRATSGSYLAMATMLRDAHRAGAGFVNLGASVGLPGVHAFKTRWGGFEHPIRALSLRLAALAQAADVADRVAARRLYH